MNTPNDENGGGGEDDDQILAHTYFLILHKHIKCTDWLTVATHRHTHTHIN